jgi:hypothetical protein
MYYYAYTQYSSAVHAFGLLLPPVLEEALIFLLLLQVLLTTSHLGR